MSVLDTLTILIDADATGIDKVLKTTIQTVTGSVDKMNKEEVDWTSIFTRSVSPAIIGAVASMFALAISNLSNFNNAATNLNNVATPATNALSDSMGLATDQAVNMALQSGASMADTVAAFEAFTKAGLDSAAATQATTDAAGIARDTGESMASVVKELVDLFQNWGVTTTPQVTAALTGLVNAAQNGKFSFDELVSSISQQGGVLKASTNISDIALNLAVLSKQSGLTKTDIINSFQAIAGGVADPLSQIDILVGNMAKAISSGPDGLTTAFELVQNKVSSMGLLAAQAVLSSTGLSKGAIKDFSTVSATDLNNVATAVDYLRTHLVDLNTDLKQHESFMGKVGEVWNNFVTYLTSAVGPELSLIGKDFVTIGTFFNNAFGSAALAVLDTFGNKILSITKTASSVIDETFGGKGGSDLYDLLHPSSAGASNPITTNNNNSSNVSLKTTINMSSPGQVSALGKDFANQLYNLFMGISK